MNIIKSPQDSIEAYLYDEVNINIYNFFVDSCNNNEIKILENFNELYREFNFFNENKENYLIIKKHFEYYKDNSHINVDIDLVHEAYFNNIDIFLCLIKLIDFYFIENHNEVILKSCELIKSISNKYNDNETIKKKFDFNFTLKHIKTLATIKEKIIYLTEVKTDYLQNPQSEIFGISFKEKCELEIQKLKELLDLEKITEITHPQQIETINEPELKTPYKIALLHELGFFKLDTIKKLTKENQYKIIKDLTGCTVRTIKGNVLVLDPNSNEDRIKYTSNNYTDEVKNYLYKLK
jgi:uncharacterized protein YerC